MPVPRKISLLGQLIQIFDTVLLRKFCIDGFKFFKGKFPPTYSNFLFGQTDQKTESCTIIMIVDTIMIKCG